MVGNIACKAHFMGHHHHGAALFGQGLHDLEHFTDQLRVQSRGGFVEQHDFRLHRQGPGNGHALLLTAGQVGRVFAFDLGCQAHLVQVLACALDGFLALDAEHMHRGFDDVFQHGHVLP